MSQKDNGMDSVHKCQCMLIMPSQRDRTWKVIQRRQITIVSESDDVDQHKIDILVIIPCKIKVGKMYERGNTEYATTPWGIYKYYNIGLFILLLPQLE